MSTGVVREEATAWDVAGVSTVLERSVTEGGRRLLELIEASPVLLVFLRHAGCTFCREALADIAQAREEIESTGTHIVLVHMGDREELGELAHRHHVQTLDRICDPDRELYRAFGLKQGKWRQLFGPKVWLRGVFAGLGRGHGLGRPSADVRQMPGVFYVDQGVIARAYRHKSAADRPQYRALCSAKLPKDGHAGR